MSFIKQLRVVTREITAPSGFDLANHLPENPTAFIRNHQGIIGFGEAARFEAQGPNRISELSETWKQQVESSFITDPLQLPGSGLIAFGSISFSEASEYPSELIVPRIILGNRDGRTWITKITPEGEEEASADFYKSVMSYPKNEKLVFLEGAQTKAEFLNACKKALAKIRSGRIQKVVLARDLVAKLPNGFDLRQPLQDLTKKYPSCWVYSVGGNFGASPELLVRVSHGQVSARVLAGTISRGESTEADQLKAQELVASLKNLQEHRFAVESMATALEQFCHTVDTDETPFALALPNLWHLASDVYGKLNADASALDLAASLHPTAAVAGTPRDAAEELIHQLEPFDRGGYSGPIGWIGSDGDGEWAIALRGAVIEDDVLTAFAGCGLVAESEPESELQETELKFEPIRSVLS